MLEMVQAYQEIPKQIRRKLKEANIYYSEIYYKSECREKELYYMYNEAGILVVPVQRKLFFRFALLPTEPFVYGEVFEEKSFLDEIVLFCKEKLHIDWIGPSSATALFSDSPQNSQAIPFGSHVIDLSLSKDELWANLHSKHRNVVRKAEKDGVKIRIGKAELLPDYQKLDEATWERSGQKKNLMPVYQKLFVDYPAHAVLYMAYYNEVPQGGAIFLKNEAMSYYLYGASKDSPLTGAMNALHWRAMLDFKEERVRKYSFVGCRIQEDADSKYHGIQRFKQRFGGELIVGKMFKVILNPGKYRLFQILQKMKNGYWVQDVVDQEIGKWTK